MSGGGGTLSEPGREGGKERAREGGSARARTTERSHSSY